VEQSTIARSYASALFELAERKGEFESYARALTTVNVLLDSDRRVADFLRSPRISVDAKKQVLRSAFESRVPSLFLNFLMVVLDKRRQRLLRQITHEYDQLMDERLGRMNVQVTLAHPPDARELTEISARLARLVGRTVIPHVHVDRNILGGIIARFGDRLLDGSLRRRLISLRGRLVESAASETKRS
jgi:F-type H+-transporting ATPase subunit delta